jgi:hypothetical protein
MSAQKEEKVDTEQSTLLQTPSSPPPQTRGVTNSVVPGSPFHTLDLPKKSIVPTTQNNATLTSKSEAIKELQEVHYKNLLESFKKTINSKKDESGNFIKGQLVSIRELKKAHDEYVRTSGELLGKTALIEANLEKDNIDYFTKLVKFLEDIVKELRPLKEQKLLNEVGYATLLENLYNSNKDQLESAIAAYNKKDASNDINGLSGRLINISKFLFPDFEIPAKQ